MTPRLLPITKVFLLLALPGALCAEQPIIPIWPGVAPGSESWTHKEVEYKNAQGEPMVRNIVRPTLTAFLPDKATANGTAIVVCPGGGFRFLSWQSEGTAVAEWLRARGVAAFVLRYRVVDTGATEEDFQKKMAEFWKSLRTGGTDAVDQIQNIRALAAEDGRQAIRVIRSRAAEWGIAKDRIGIMGFSAGGMVTMGVALHHDDGSRPNFSAPIYGTAPKGVPVPEDAAPVFLLAASDDPLVPPTASQQIYADWNAAKKSAEIHIYSKGGHGFGMHHQNLPIDHWIDVFGEWLKLQGYLK